MQHDILCIMLRKNTLRQIAAACPVPPAEQHRGLLRAEMMRELCVELIYNYYFNEHSFSFACASIFYFTCILIRLNGVSLNCVVSCHALIQYTRLFLKCLRCMIFIGATQNK